VAISSSSFSSYLWYNIYVSHTSECESLGVWGLCNNKQLIPITDSQFRFDDLTPPQLPPPPPPPPPAAPVSLDNNPCNNLPSSIRDSFVQQARDACARVIDQSECYFI
jgi:hypothetical protein